MMVNHLRYQVLMPFIIVDSKSLPLSVDSLVDSCRSTTFGMLSEKARWNLIALQIPRGMRNIDCPTIQPWISECNGTWNMPEDAPAFLETRIFWKISRRDMRGHIRTFGFGIRQPTLGL